LQSSASSSVVIQGHRVLVMSPIDYWDVARS
jgi:hypothetical protein